MFGRLMPLSPLSAHPFGVWGPLLAAVPPTNPDDAIRLVDTVSQRGLVWWLTGMVLLGGVILWLLVRVIMKNHAQLVHELRAEKNQLAEQLRKDREASEIKAGRLHEQLLATNQRFVEQLQPVITANTQAQQRSSDALQDVERTMRDGVGKITQGLHDMSDDVQKSHDCCQDAKESSAAALRSVEAVHQTVRDGLTRPPRSNPR